MAKIRIVGDTSGYIEIAAPSAAGNNTLELPSSSTKLVGSDDNGNVNISGIITATTFNGNVTGNFISTTGISTISQLNVTSSVGFSSTSPQTSLDLSQKTDGIALPQGTTAQRPSGSNPYLRWNTSNSALEFYNGTDWVEIISDYFPSGSVILG
jgi:hypothetical protein